MSDPSGRPEVTIAVIHPADKNMAEPIELAYEYWKDASQKLDYFMLGLSAAVFAYEAEHWTPVILGNNPGTIELVGILFILVSIFFGFLRLQGFVNLFFRSHLRLIAEGVQNKLSADLIHFEEFMDPKTGDPVDREVVSNSAQKAKQAKDANEKRLAKIKKWSGIHYKVRNWSFFLGFVYIVVGKILTPYLGV